MLQPTVALNFYDYVLYYGSTCSETNKNSMIWVVLKSLGIKIRFFKKIWAGKLVKKKYNGHIKEFKKSWA